MLMQPLSLSFLDTKNCLEGVRFRYSFFRGIQVFVSQFFFSRVTQEKILDLDRDPDHNPTKTQLGSESISYVDLILSIGTKSLININFRLLHIPSYVLADFFIKVFKDTLRQDFFLLYTCISTCIHVYMDIYNINIYVLLYMLL